MLSSDKNVETIAQLAEIVKHYMGLQAEYLKLDVVDKLSRLLTAATMAIAIFLAMIAVATFFSLAFAFWLSAYTGLVGAFLVVGGIHLLFIIIAYRNRIAWIERPLVRFLANLLLNK